jgi:hypothetical protein
MTNFMKRWHASRAGMVAGWRKILFHYFHDPTKDWGRFTPVIHDGGPETVWIGRRKEN